jgi:hypothetical protein
MTTMPNSSAFQSSYARWLSKVDMARRSPWTNHPFDIRYPQLALSFFVRALSSFHAQADLRRPEVLSTHPEVRLARSSP